TWASSTIWLRSASSGNLRQRDHLALATLDQRANVVVPRHQRSAYLTLVGASVVDARRSRLVAALMVQNLLDHVREKPDVRNFGGNVCANVGGCPSGDARALVKLRLATRPSGEAAAA